MGDLTVFTADGRKLEAVHAGDVYRVSSPVMFPIQGWRRQDDLIRRP